MSGELIQTFVKRLPVLVLPGALIMLTLPREAIAAPEVPRVAQTALQPAQMTPKQLQQLVAPIALYPDELVAEVLAAATYPSEIVEANRWLQENSSLKGDQLAAEVDKQPWDPSVKALTEFPSVLANMDKNLSWTSSLGDAYFNHAQDVLDAVQVMRKHAQDAGTLKTTPQQTVTTEGQTIIIEPTDPEVVYVPTYDPWFVYGAPLVDFPGYVDYFLGPFISFGFPVHHFHRHFPWGWHFWGCNWRDRVVVFNHNTFISRSHTFINRNERFGNERDFIRQRNGLGDHSLRGSMEHPLDHRADRGFVAPRIKPGNRSGAFSGFEHGGDASGFSSRGQSSLGGTMHGGFAGGMHGGAGGAMHNNGGGMPGGFG